MIKRSTDVSYTLTNLFKNSCKIITEDNDFNFPRPFYYDNRRLFEYGLKTFVGIHFVNVTGQIQYTFEQAIPQLAKEYNFTEQLNVSLYLKNNIVKLEVGIGKGKKLYDKRQDIAKKDAERRMLQHMKNQ